MEYESQLIERYRSKGVLIDAGLLLLFFVGSLQRDLVGRQKHTKEFVPEDYDLLNRLLALFSRCVTIPNILTEVNGLSKFSGPLKGKYFEVFGRGIEVLTEQFVESAVVAKQELFSKIGLTDTAIIHVAVECGYLVITDDLELYLRLQHSHVDALNFNHLRKVHWDWTRLESK